MKAFEVEEDWIASYNQDVPCIIVLIGKLYAAKIVGLKKSCENGEKFLPSKILLCVVSIAPYGSLFLWLPNSLCQLMEKPQVQY